MRKRCSKIDTPTSKDTTGSVDDLSRAISASLYAKGETIRVWHDYYWHFGISDGAGRVIHKSKAHGKVVYTSLFEFSRGGQVLKCPNIRSKDLLLAYKNAEKRMGESYGLISRNCEHFVNEVHGLPSKSDQVDQAVCAGLIILIGMAFSR